MIFSNPVNRRVASVICNPSGFTSLLVYTAIIHAALDIEGQPGANDEGVAFVGMLVPDSRLFPKSFLLSRYPPGMITRTVGRFM